jgi:hypothetical protein
MLISQAAWAQSTDVVGIWNLETRNLAMRATGGVRNVILRIQESGGELQAQMTSPRSTFLDVQEFRYDDGELYVAFGAYEYTLNLEGGQLTGTMFSPVDTVRVTGRRQEGTMYVGDEPEVFHSTRTALLGHRTSLAPPDDEPDPVAWVRARIDSVEDVAFIVRGHPVSFENSAEFEDELMAYAGRRVTITGTWVGERIQIEEIELASDGGR